MERSRGRAYLHTPRHSATDDESPVVICFAPKSALVRQGVARLRAITLTNEMICRRSGL